MHNESFTKIKWLITHREIINACPKYDQKKHIYTFSGQKVFFSPTTTEASDTQTLDKVQIILKNDLLGHLK